MKTIQEMNLSSDLSLKAVEICNLIVNHQGFVTLFALPIVIENEFVRYDLMARYYYIPMEKLDGKYFMPKADDEEWGYNGIRADRVEPHKTDWGINDIPLIKEEWPNGSFDKWQKLFIVDKTDKESK